MVLTIAEISLPAVQAEWAAAAANGQPAPAAPPAALPRHGSRGATTCERLRELHRQDPDFAETASIREVAKRIGRWPAAFSDSHYYNTVLKPKRAEVAARKKRVNRAQKWGDFNSVGGPREDPEDH